jgi:hypothetical protein
MKLEKNDELLPLEKTELEKFFKLLVWFLYGEITILYGRPKFYPHLLVDVKSSLYIYFSLHHLLLHNTPLTNLSYSIAWFYPLTVELFISGISSESLMYIPFGSLFYFLNWRLGILLLNSNLLLNPRKPSSF